MYGIPLPVIIGVAMIAFVYVMAWRQWRQMTEARRRGDELADERALERRQRMAEEARGREERMLEEGPVGTWTSATGTFGFMRSDLTFFPDGTAQARMLTTLSGDSGERFRWRMGGRGVLQCSYPYDQWDTEDDGAEGDLEDETDDPVVVPGHEDSYVFESRFEFRHLETDAEITRALVTEGRDEFVGSLFPMMYAGPPRELERPSSGDEAPADSDGASR